MLPKEARPPTSPTARAVQLLLAAVIGVAFVGFVVGIRQTPSPYEASGVDHAHVSVDAADRMRDAVVPAMSYEDFDPHKYGPNSQWRSSLADLEQPEVDLFEEVTWDEAARAVALRERARRRAFDGAPSVVPHPIDQMSSTSCMACHGEGMFIAEAYAPPMPHEFMVNCTQCHVEQNAADFPGTDDVSNSFVGLSGPLLSERAWHGAPPVIPHSTFMRENCMTCHGPTGVDAFRTTHPWQTNCMQCHAPSALLDQAVVDAERSFLPAPEVRKP